MRSVRAAHRLAVLALVMLLGACSGSGRSEPTGSDPKGFSASYDGTWTLIEGQGPDGEVAIIDGYRVSLTIEGNLISGTAPCNGYFGDATIDGTSFTVPGVGITEMGCRRDVMKAESAYVSAISDADTIGREKDVLTLTGDETELVFELEPPIPTADLVGTRWELESLIYGTGDDGVATSVKRAYLIIKKDGTIEGTTGCREYVRRVDRGRQRDRVHDVRREGTVSRVDAGTGWPCGHRPRGRVHRRDRGEPFVGDFTRRPRPGVSSSQLAGTRPAG